MRREPKDPLESEADPKSEIDVAGIDFGHVVARAAANSHDLEGLTRPLLEALAKLANLESTFLTEFDWHRREQEVRFAHNIGEVLIIAGMKVPLPPGVLAEALPGVTRSPTEMSEVHPDSQVAKQLGLKTYVSVPINLPRHQLFGMLCGASRAPRQISESVVSVMEFFSQIIADHVTRTRVAATEKRAGVAEEQLRARARFLAEAEHMLKTPLSAIEGVSITLLDRWEGLPDERRGELLEALARNAQELRVMIDELLDEARADIQTRELAPIDIDLHPLVDRVAKAFANVSKTHAVHADLSPGVMVRADPGPLYQILAHLLDNAIKYSPQGGTITIRATGAKPDVLIEVVDDGIGLPEEGDVFKPFWRGDSTDNKALRGIGLGLHIVRSLTEAMGGTVMARSNPVGGATFTVRLPAAP